MKNKKIAFIVGAFPEVSTPFIINQIADLHDRGIAVDIFAFDHGDRKHISQRYEDYALQSRTRYLTMPDTIMARYIQAVPMILRLVITRPKILLRCLNIFTYGKNAATLKILYWVYPFIGTSYDLYHCHFGRMGNRFLIIRDILDITTPFVTSFYGQDVSRYIKQKGIQIYDRLKKECAHFIVMSNNMKDRIVAHGFDASKITVLPVSIDVPSYPFEKRAHTTDEPVQLVSIGRFVHKKGFDDLLRALAIVKKQTDQSFHCDIYGGGPLQDELYDLTDTLKLRDVVTYHGYITMEDIAPTLLQKDLFIQPSKTAPDGDME